MPDLLVGADVGGSSTRVAVATVADGILQTARGGPGNPTLVGLAGSAAEIRTVAARALRGLDGRVVCTVVGLAGGSLAATDPGFVRAVLPEGVEPDAVVVSDLAVAFSSGTAASGGCTLIAGTGAVAARIVGDELRDRRDGWGWLLGDRGSGFWLGQAAVRSTLAALDDGRPLGRLHHDVLATAGAADYLGLVRATYAHVPTWLAGFAPLVSRWADEDPAAGAIADDAARLLADTLAELAPRTDEPVVLGGSVLAGPGPVSRRFEARLAPGMTLLRAESGLVGATWIAARRSGRADPALHARLSATAPGATRR